MKFEHQTKFLTAKRNRLLVFLLGFWIAFPMMSASSLKAQETEVIDRRASTS